MQFIVFAHDGEGVYERRMAVRPRHLENIARVNAEGHVVCAGGILNDEGRLAGSALVMDFESREQLDEYLASEPYVTEKVWEDIKIETMNVMIANQKKG